MCAILTVKMIKQNCTNLSGVANTVFLFKPLSMGESIQP